MKINLSMIVPATNFYNFNPTKDHQTGDIWSNMPTYGLLNFCHLSAIIITPACDLANNKADAITYLPIISIGRYLTSKMFLPKIFTVIKNLSNGINNQALSTWLQNERRQESVSELITNLRQMINTRNSSILNRIIIGIELYSNIQSNIVTAFSKHNYHTLFGEKRFEEIIDSIITNSFMSDISFVPQDNQDLTWSIIPEPSVILFRFPLTAPIEIFDYALQISETNWKSELLKNYSDLPFVNEFSQYRPLKALQIRIEFLHDILIRFTSLYSRLGAPNFSEHSLKTIKDKIL